MHFTDTLDDHYTLPERVQCHLSMILVAFTVTLSGGKREVTLFKQVVLH